jgi:hypothetical protein
MPGQGTRSVFTIGLRMGIWLGILATLGLAHTRPWPRRGAVAGVAWVAASGMPRAARAAPRHTTRPGASQSCPEYLDRCSMHLCA